ncbi:hypothetical protein J437_LFUL001697 [Ladona fulva]|uniref:Uncharacterized protein n=1 Tax=Ladona fulva TaxID=123851 RepID=A0A8K0K376_LADFU|nr:hypothetical protein J437_LFUL001697 [Ladona fulva]
MSKPAESKPPTPAAEAPKPVVPEATDPVKTGKPVKKTIIKPKHSTSISFDITNKTALSDLAKKYNPPTPPAEVQPPTTKSDYFEKLDVAIRMELDHGQTHTIDVQPDLRFPFQYFLYNVSNKYPDLTTKSHPFVSTFTLVAYQQILFNSFLLICDLYSRDQASFFAQRYKNVSQKMDLLTKLLDCHIPQELELLLSQLAPTYDPQRKLMTFVPSLAGFDFNLDLGRIVPPQMMILAHHLLASVRTNSEPETILRTFYAAPILTVNEVVYTPSHFLGAYFDINQRPTNHPNWLNSRFENVFNPVIGRALIQRPTLAKARMIPSAYDAPEDIDPYEFLLAFSEDNIGWIELE